MKNCNNKSGWATILVAIAGLTALSICSNKQTSKIAVPKHAKIESVFREAQWHLNGGKQTMLAKNQFAMNVQHYRR
jgi:hypothetical protein